MSRFSILSNQLGTQIELLSAALLTRIAVQTSFVDLLPVVSYLTRLNVFVLTSTALFFLALMASLWTSSLVQKIDVERAERFYRSLRFVFPGAFSATLLYFFGGWLGNLGLQMIAGPIPRAGTT